MKRFILLFAFVSLSISLYAQEIDQKRIDFVNKFYLAVINHKQSKVIKLMDKDYRKEQLDFLNGNKEQFVDELFSGVDQESSKFINSELKNIEAMEIQDVKEAGKDKWEYTFLVEAGPYKMEISLLLKKNKKKYGFVGASG
ncbi:MAG: hypothetical protein AB8B56_19875 [Crocinitomicaceae bacterium]